MINDELSQKVIGLAYHIHNTMGFGFVEKVYENCLAHDLRKNNISFEQQRAVNVYYDGECVGEYVADLIIVDTLLIELKSVHELIEKHEVQLVNYLTATTMDVGLLLNFGPDGVEVRRKYRVYDPSRATHVHYETDGLTGSRE
mgnify:CR=1 FL=1